MSQSTKAPHVLPAAMITRTVAVVALAVAMLTGGAGARAATTQYPLPLSAWGAMVVDGAHSHVFVSGGSSVAVRNLDGSADTTLGGLTSASGNAYTASMASGQVSLKIPGDAGAGQVDGGALEASTVDLSTEFTNLITTQRAYSASSKIITTADEMLQDLLAVIR